jgi:hypothetical protein
MESEKGSWKVLNLLFLDTGNFLVWGQRSVSNEKWARRLWLEEGGFLQAMIVLRYETFNSWR